MAATALLLFAVPARAQSGGFYVGGAWLAALRDSGRTDFETHRSFIQSVTAAAGVRLNQSVGVEGEIGLQPDVPIRVSPRVAIAPALRFTYMNRRDYLTGHGHRGPATGSGFTTGFGVAVRWSAPPAAP